jgi:type II secretory pathway pseudopilin PulG
MDRTSNNAGYSLVEIMAAVSIVVTALGMSMSGFVFLMKSQVQREQHNELDIEVQAAAENLKSDLRLSSLDMMFFYPADAAYHTAVSFPLARDDDGDGVIDLDEDGHIVWDRTIVYHVWQSSPNELRVTTFDPRDNDMADNQRQAQLNSVVENGHGGYAYNGGNASTRRIFSNLFTWSIRPKGAVYDGYALAVERDVAVDLGSCLLDADAHVFRFTAVGQNSSSTGFKIGVDSLVVSASAAPREGEAQLPVTDEQGATAQAQIMDGGSWNGNYQLAFDAQGIGDYFTLTLGNDRWEERNFQGTGDSFEDTEVVFDRSLDPDDFVLRLVGMTNTWYGSEQTDDTNGVSSAQGEFKGCAIRVLAKGEQMFEGDYIGHGGAACKVKFRAGVTTLSVLGAYIAECASSSQPSMDVVAGTECLLRFGGSVSCSIPAGESAWSDLATFAIDREKSYTVTYLLQDNAATTTPWQWADSGNPGATNAFVLPDGALAGFGGGTPLATWSTLTNVAATNAAVAVAEVYATYPDGGVYTSCILDTQLERPVYNTLEWSSDLPPGSLITMRMRTGNDPDMSDAWAWTNITGVTVSGQPIAVPVRRYVQFQATLDSSVAGADTPLLKDVTITWAGQQRVVDIGGTFTRGPDYGQFELLVDGQSLKTGILVDLELYRDVRGFNRQGSSRITSAVAAEVSPRNTGR